MAASPSQQTHWLKLRVDLKLERLSGMDLTDWSWIREPSSLPLLCDAVVMACTHTHTHRADRQELGGGGLEKSYAFFCVLPWVLQAHSKENIMDRPLREPPQKI